MISPHVVEIFVFVFMSITNHGVTKDTRDRVLDRFGGCEVRIHLKTWLWLISVIYYTGVRSTARELTDLTYLNENSSGVWSLVQEDFQFISNILLTIDTIQWLWTRTDSSRRNLTEGYISSHCHRIETHLDIERQTCEPFHLTISGRSRKCDTNSSHQFWNHFWI